MKHYLVNPTWRCQNKCRYCWMQQSVRQRPDLVGAPERECKDWIAAIKRDRPDVIDVAGGEPMLVPWLPELFMAYDDLPFGLSTNGLVAQAVRRLAMLRLGNVVSINVSYHPDTLGRIEDYDARWQAATRMLRDAGYRVHSNVVDYSNNQERAAAMLAWLKAEGIPAEVSPYEEVGTLNALTTLGLECAGGVDHLTIAPDGSAWPCLTTLRSPYWRETRLGNWIDNMLDLRRKPQPCYLQCVDYYVLPQQHSAGDMWQIKARPAGQP